MKSNFRFFENGRIAGVKALAKNKTVCAIASGNAYSCTENNATNAWNVNISNGGANNNKYNSYIVAAVAALADDEIQLWIDAFDDCCRNKRTSSQCTLYRLQYEEDLLRLASEVKNKVYTQRESDAFCVKKPKVREIFAASFRDRVAQHWVTLHLEPLFEDLFVEIGDVSYNCRRGYGTLAAVRRQTENIRRVSNNWTDEAWVGSGDIQAFFMSIDKHCMWHKLKDFIEKRYNGQDIEELLWLSHNIIMHKPEKNCNRKGDLSLWSKLPEYKSLFGSEPNKGMPIGNITTQLTANFYMSEFDRWAVRKVAKFSGSYIRFVDDMRVTAKQKEDIRRFYKDAEAELFKIGLTLHPHKRYLQRVAHGDAFVGSIIKPHRTYISNRTRGSMLRSLKTLDLYCRNPNEEMLARQISSVNSYMGLLSHYNTYAIRREALSKATALWSMCVVENMKTVKRKRYGKEIQRGGSATDYQ